MLEFLFEEYENCILYNNSKDDKFSMLSISKQNYENHTTISLTVETNSSDNYEKICNDFNVNIPWNSHISANVEVTGTGFVNGTIKFKYQDNYESQKKIEDILNYCKTLHSTYDGEKLSNWHDKVIAKLIAFLPYKYESSILKEDLKAAEEKIQQNIDISNNICRLQEIAYLKTKEPELEDISNKAATLLSNYFYSFCSLSIEKNDSTNYYKFLANALKYASFGKDTKTCSKIIINEIYKDEKGFGLVLEKSVINQDTIDALVDLAQHNPESVLKAIQEQKKIVKLVTIKEQEYSSLKEYKAFKL